MILIKPPKTDFTDHYDQSKFKLLWNFGIALVILLSGVSVSNYSNPNYSSIPNVIAVAIAVSALVVLAVTKKYKLVSIFTIISCFILISLTYFLLEDILHYTTPLWMILNILLAFFILGKKWGIPLLIAHFIVLFFYVALRLEKNIENLPPFDNSDVLNFVIESSIVAAGITYLLIQFIKTNKYAETELKQTNQALKEQNHIITVQNEEKETMLKEIHHRVKNNLQVITSLLRLQSYEIEDEAQSKAFKDAINRVKSMALIHETMYKSDTLSNFDVEGYLKSLAAELLEAYAVKKPIELEVQSEIVNIGAKSIVPVSLLFNELISNSIKHAFTSVENAKIQVELTPHSSQDRFNLDYRDNGKWVDFEGKSFGVELIGIMTEQLEGKFSLEKSEEGTHYSFELKILND
jgi:two-component system, sensor histidine kinase PdtaS